MSLYGALFSGVAGLAGQANKIGTISDNISNVNTVGYKSTEGLFETLVTNSGTIAYSPGGVLGRSRSSVSLQGLLQTTNNNTDVAISGNGFFIVNDAADSSGTVSYTRAGSWRQDSTGNFQNAAGYYLQGWPLDRDGRLPGEPGNTNTTSSSSLTSVETVNVSSFTGSAAATTSIELSANLEASQTQFQGAGAIADMDTTTANPNSDNTSTEIIIPDTAGSYNSVDRGDQFLFTSGGGNTLTVRYGGFSFSKLITSGGAGDSGVATPPTPETLGNDPLSITSGDQTVTVRHGNHGLATGDVVTLSGVASALNGVPAGDFNIAHVITVVDADSYTIEVATTPTSTDTTAGAAAVQSDFRVFAGNVLDATTATGTFLSTTGTTGFNTDALSFTITSATTGTATFTYSSGTPNTANGQFNTLTNLATAINSTTGLTARVVSGRLYVSASDANEALTFANGDIVGTGTGTSLKRGIDWVGELGLKNVRAGTNRFSTLAGLADVVNADSNFGATLTNPDSDSSVTLFVNDPLDTVIMTDVPVVSTTQSPTTIQATANSTTVTVNYTSAHGYQNGDIITLNPAAISGYSSANNTGVTIGTAGTTTITVTHTAAHGLSSGDYFVDMSSFTGFSTDGNVGGVPIHEMHGLQTITVTSATTYTFVSNSTATSTTTSAGSTLTSYGTFDGISYSDLSGSFEIFNQGTNSFDISVATTADSATVSTSVTGMTSADPSNSGSLVKELGLDNTPLAGASYTAIGTTGTLGPAYAASDATKNMASGTITPQYFTNIRVFDSLGTGHDIRVAFIKTGSNRWAAEVYAVPSTDVSSSFANGQLASGTVQFNGDGSLFSVESTLTSAISITWENGAAASSITLDWGTTGAIGTGDTDGMSQFDAAYRLNFANQNGVPVGELIGVEIDTGGTVIARFSNGEEQSLYKIPLADFSNPDGLESNTGNVFLESRESGTVNLREPGSSGVGTLQSSALESSNVELSEQLTSMIIAQRSYQANTKVITASDDLLEELNRTVG